MNAKLGYLLNGKFHLIYSASLLGVDTYTKNNFKNRQELLEKKKIPKDSNIVIYCTDENGKALYNRKGFPLQSTVLYGNSKLTDIQKMVTIVMKNRKLLRNLTEELNFRFSNTTGISFPGSIYKLTEILNKNENAVFKYYYVVKQASLEYYQAQIKEEKMAREGQKEERLEITIKSGKLSVHGDNVQEYLTECQDRKDYDDFWNMASLDDLRIVTVPSEVKRHHRKIKSIESIG